MFKRFQEVVTSTEGQGKKYTLTLTPIQVTTLHGAIALVMRHPEVKTKDIMSVLKAIRQETLDLMRLMGFTEDEVQYLDTKEV